MFGYVTVIQSSGSKNVILYVGKVFCSLEVEEINKLPSYDFHIFLDSN